MLLQRVYEPEVVMSCLSMQELVQDLNESCKLPSKQHNEITTCSALSVPTGHSLSINSRSRQRNPSTSSGTLHLSSRNSSPNAEC